MELERRLLILSCSQRKERSQALLPAITRYDGPAFRVVRRFFREQPNETSHLDVFIISAVYGLIAADCPITYYDQIMTPDRVARLRSPVSAAFTNLLSKGYTDICLTMSSLYLKVFDSENITAAPSSTLTIASGSQGMRLAQLKRWLWKVSAADNLIMREPITTRYRGVARIRGIELHLTPDEVLKHARIALITNESSAQSSREWYVAIDDKDVAPKWLVSSLTGLSVSSFSADEARRVLRQLGIETRRFEQKSKE